MMTIEFVLVCRETNPRVLQNCGCRHGIGTNHKQAQKSVSGIIGSSKKKQYVAKWEIVYHEMLAITNLHRELAGLGTTSYELDVNRAFSMAATEFEEANIRSILDVIERNENPFTTPTTDSRLHNIQTKEVMTDDIRNQLLNAEKIGKVAYESLRKERFCEKNS